MMFFNFYIMENFDFLTILICVVGALIALVSIFSIGVAIYLLISYVKYNRQNNSCLLSGEEVARKLLDDNNLQHIKIKTSGSILFGNSYSHYFKKIRLRRLTIKKKSLTSLAMASQKVSLAILDSENDEDMRKRVRYTPIVFFGPYAFIPILILGIILDIIFFNFTGIITLLALCIGVFIFVLSFVFNFIELKTEKKAQKRAIEILQKENLANDDEIEKIKQLYKLYNIEYINNIVLSILEIIYNILRIIASSKANNSN